MRGLSTLCAKDVTETEAAKRKVIAAQADADAQKATADAEAYSIRVKAEAEAEANALINASLTDALIDYTRAQKWDGQYPLYLLRWWRRVYSHDCN